MRRKTDDLSFTDDELAALDSSRTPEVVRQFVARQRTTAGARTTAYRKVAALARAEREALVEIRLLQAERITSGAIPQGGPLTPALGEPSAMPVRPVGAPERVMAIASGDDR